jgi:uncharacterized protein (TIGR03085 family)
MTRQNHAANERAAICDLLTTLGPDQPTLCEGWTTRDLAAHLVVRERRPLAAFGLVVPPLSGYTERTRRRHAARPYGDLVARLRHPPGWAGAAAVDRTVNTVEMYLHHEDIRRGQPDWRPRDLPAAMGRILWSRVSLPARLRLRRFPATVVIEATGCGQLHTGAGGDRVHLSGDPGELALFLTGRQRAARVRLDGPEALTARLATARLNW